MRIATQVLLLSTLLAPLASPVAAQRSQPGWIGISLDLPSRGRNARDDGLVVIGEVRRGSPAEAAGLRAGDRLLAVGDLTGLDDFRNLPERLRLSVGDPVRIRIERDGRPLEVVLRAVERPSDVRSRTILLAMDPDSMVESMMQAMDSLRMQLTRVRGEPAQRSSPAGQLRVVREDRSSAVNAPFEFFVFRGEVHDSLRQAMEDLNSLSDDLKRQERIRVAELGRRTSRRGGSVDTDEQLRTVRAALEDVTRRSAELRTAMSEAAKATAGFDYTMPTWDIDVQGWSGASAPDAPPEPPGPFAFRPLTPYLLGSNRVAGAQVIDLRPELAEYFDVGSGVLIVDVAPGTPAAIAGLLPGDVIIRMDQVSVRSVEDLRFGLSRSQESLPLSLVRQGSTLEVLLNRR